MFSARQVRSALLLATLTAVPASAQAPLELVVNIPAGRLDVLQAGERIRSYPVSVGAPRFATPTAEAGIRRLVWNPSWTPPESEWARDEKPAAPGWSNPMGRVKMHLFGVYYVHGTPAANERHLGRPASHGCIRMRNSDVMELAQLVLRADGAPVAESTVQRLVRNPRATREIALTGNVRVRIEYRLAEVGTDSVTLHPDVYGRAGRGYTSLVREELARAGVDPAPVLAQLQGTRTPTTAVRLALGSPPMPVRLPEVAMETQARPVVSVLQ
jgi:murein L,D-transpeptidase YcbB/YkuD